MSTCLVTLTGMPDILFSVMTNVVSLLTRWHVCRHEDGSIRFWDVSGVAVSLLYKLQTMNIFGDGLVEQGAADADEEWPPFRKVCSLTTMYSTSGIRQF